MMQKRIFSALLAAMLLLSLTACQGIPASEPSATAEPPATPSQESLGEDPPSGSQEEMAVPEDTTQLKVSLQVTSPEDENEGAYPSGKLEYSTQADVDACRQWLFDLKAGEITVLYGEAVPYDHYWTGEMSLEDSQEIVDLLRSIAPGLAPLEGGNPPTGGGWSVAVHTGDEVASLGYNGEWVTFVRQGKGYIFDGTGTPARESCDGIGALLSKYISLASPAASNTAPSATEMYFPSDVEGVYALDTESYLMAQVEDGYPESKAIWEGLKNRAHSGGEPSGYGYLILTTEGKEYIYLDDSEEDQTLNQYCKAALRDDFLHPSWLIHMTPERMVSANGITDQDKLLAFAKVLKEEVIVGEETSVHSGSTNPDMPAGLVHVMISFDSGVEYTIIGYLDGDGNGPFSIHTSDLDKTVTYQSINGSLGKIKAFLEKQR